jgi:hypothetical protein
MNNSTVVRVLMTQDNPEVVNHSCNQVLTPDMISGDQVLNKSIS